MRGWTNAQRNDASDGVTLIAEDLTYSNGQRIQFFALTGKSWFSIASNKTDITLKKGGRYFITYSFTPSTADGGIAGPDNYANAKVWDTGGYSMFFDQTNGDRVFYLYNNGTASNTFAWFRMTILRMGGINALLGKARALLQEVLSHAGRYQCDKSKGQDSQSRRYCRTDCLGRSICEIERYEHIISYRHSVLREERHIEQLRDAVVSISKQLGRSVSKDDGRRNGIGHSGQVSQRNGEQSTDNLILTKGLVS